MLSVSLEKRLEHSHGCCIWEIASHEKTLPPLLWYIVVRGRRGATAVAITIQGENGPSTDAVAVHDGETA